VLPIIHATGRATVDFQPFLEATVTGEIPRNHADYDGIERRRLLSRFLRKKLSESVDIVTQVLR
jgi:hypothetical protein